MHSNATAHPIKDAKWLAEMADSEIPRKGAHIRLATLIRCKIYGQRVCREAVTHLPSPDTSSLLSLVHPHALLGEK